MGFMKTIGRWLASDKVAKLTDSKLGKSFLGKIGQATEDIVTEINTKVGNRSQADSDILQELHRSLNASVTLENPSDATASINRRKKIYNDKNNLFEQAQPISKSLEEERDIKASIWADERDWFNCTKEEIGDYETNQQTNPNYAPRSGQSIDQLKNLHNQAARNLEEIKKTGLIDEDGTFISEENYVAKRKQQIFDEIQREKIEGIYKDVKTENFSMNQDEGKLNLSVLRDLPDAKIEEPSFTKALNIGSKFHSAIRDSDLFSTSLTWGAMGGLGGLTTSAIAVGGEKLDPDTIRAKHGMLGGALSGAFKGVLAGALLHGAGSAHRMTQVVNGHENSVFANQFFATLTNSKTARGVIGGALAASQIKSTASVRTKSVNPIK